MNMKKWLFLIVAFCCLSAANVLAKTELATASQLPMRLWYDQPAQYFEESLPVGNGRLGALVYGHPDEDIVQLNDITFWTGGPYDREMDRDAH